MQADMSQRREISPRKTFYQPSFEKELNKQFDFINVLQHLHRYLEMRSHHI